MELNEDLNKQYTKDKEAYNKVKVLEEKINKIKNVDIIKYKRNMEDAITKKARAIEDKDKTVEQQADIEIKQAKAEINKLVSQAEKMRDIIDKNKAKVDSYINELSKDPEFKKQMNYILEARYNRKLKPIIGEKQQIDIIKDLCSKHPGLEYNLGGMVHAQEGILKLEEEIKTLDRIKDYSKIEKIKNEKIPELKSKKKMNQDAFMAFCEKNNISVDKDFLDKLVTEKRFAHDKSSGKIKVGKTLNALSKSYDNKIKAYVRAIEKVEGAKIYSYNQLQSGQQQNSIDKQSNIHQQSNDEQQNNDEQQQSDITKKDSEQQNKLPAEKYKWWQFVKRFKSWKQRRMEKKNEEEHEKQEDEQQTDNIPEGNLKDANNKFRDAYKYDIAKDYIDNKEKEIFHQSAKEIKNSSKDQENDR